MKLIISLVLFVIACFELVVIIRDMLWKRRKKRYLASLKPKDWN